MLNILNVKQVVDLLVFLTHEMESHKDYLTELDSACGDGDMGITFLRGARGIREGLKDYPNDISWIFIKAGQDFNNAAGSTMGALFCTALMEAGKVVKGQDEISSRDGIKMLQAAVDGVQSRGKAKLGDKTMLDALIPASETFNREIEGGSDLMTAFQAACKSAEEGAKNTTTMKASLGRARWLGDRTIGHPDPGAMAMALLFNDALKKLEDLNDPMIASMYGEKDPIP